MEHWQMSNINHYGSTAGFIRATACKGVIDIRRRTAFHWQSWLRYQDLNIRISIPRMTAIDHTVFTNNSNLVSTRSITEHKVTLVVECRPRRCHLNITRDLSPFKDCTSLTILQICWLHSPTVTHGKMLNAPTVTRQMMLSQIIEEQKFTMLPTEQPTSYVPTFPVTNRVTRSTQLTV